MLDIIWPATYVNMWSKYKGRYPVVNSHRTTRGAINVMLPNPYYEVWGY